MTWKTNTDLVGLFCSVPTLKHVGKRWWVEIKEVSHDGRFIRFSGNIAFGRARWVPFTEAGWRYQWQEQAAKQWISRTTANAV